MSRSNITKFPNTLPNIATLSDFFNIRNINIELSCGWKEQMD